MIASVLCFLILGFAFGFFADINSMLTKSTNNNIVIFFIDVFLFVIYGVAFFCMLLVTNDGVIRGAFFLGCAIGFVLYMLTLYRLFSPLRQRFSHFLKKSNNIVLSKLKSFKKLLHLTK